LDALVDFLRFGIGDADDFDGILIFSLISPTATSDAVFKSIGLTSGALVDSFFSPCGALPHV